MEVESSHGASAFLVSFPSLEDLQRVADFEVRLKSHGVVLAFSEWKVEDVPSTFQLEAVWVHVKGVPHALRHFLGLWQLVL